MAFSDYIGRPYGYGPEDDGLDCWQLCAQVLVSEFGIEPPKYEYTTHINDAHYVFTKELEKWEPVKFDHREPGDLIMFNFNNKPSHAGVIVDGKRMIHSMRGLNCCVERYISPRWIDRIYGVYRWTRS